MTPTSRYTCPIPSCGESWDQPEMQYAPGVAAVFGLDADTLGRIHLRQEEYRLENNIKAHMRKHSPEEWLPELMRLRSIVAEFGLEHLGAKL